MADGIGYSEGSGQTIATDDAGASGHVQIIKLAISADGSATVIPADATYGIDVDVTRLPAGTEYVGKVRLTDGTTDADVTATGGTYEGQVSALIDSTGELLDFSAPAQISVTPSLDTSAYASGDSMDTTVLSFTNAVNASGGSGWITAARFIDKADQGQDMTLYLFDSSVTPATENAAHALSDIDAAKYIDAINTSDGSWEDHVNNQTCTIRPTPWVPYHCTGSTTLYGVLVSRGTGTYGASDVIIELSILKD